MNEQNVQTKLQKRLPKSKTYMESENVGKYEDREIKGGVGKVTDK